MAELKLEATSNRIHKNEEQHKTIKKYHLFSANIITKSVVYLESEENELREFLRVYTPKHFKLILEDGRSFDGVVIALWPQVQKLGFSTGMRVKGAIPWKLDEIGVAFVVPESEATPPFRVQIRRQKPISVPDNKIAAPPEESELMKLMKK